MLFCQLFALLTKWMWRYKSEANSLWKAVIDSLHNTKKCWSFIPVNNSLAGVWKWIVNELDKIKVGEIKLSQNFKGVAGDGRCIRLWLDLWLGSMPLKECYPNLFKLEKIKKCKVFERYNSESKSFMGLWEWFCVPSTGIELSEWDSCIEKLDSINLYGDKDQWVWIGGKDSDFQSERSKGS
ncbi:hypothetical protein HanPSC8_Chr01g0027301 [Helianthus annuus]|nr:hypothetical protein HanPSC8_Chr01g0027301 [Helianthus annuus]